MISAWWLLPVFIIGTWVGVLLAALCEATKE